MEFKEVKLPDGDLIQYKDGLYTFVGQNRQIVVLNGERRARGVLRVGDRIRVGTATVVFQSAGEDRVRDAAGRYALERAHNGESDGHQPHQCAAHLGRGGRQAASDAHLQGVERSLLRREGH